MRRKSFQRRRRTTRRTMRWCLRKWLARMMLVVVSVSAFGSLLCVVWLLLHLFVVGAATIVSLLSEGYTSPCRWSHHCIHFGGQISSSPWKDVCLLVGGASTASIIAGMDCTIANKGHASPCEWGCHRVYSQGDGCCHCHQRMFISLWVGLPQQPLLHWWMLPPPSKDVCLLLGGAAMLIVV